MKVVNLEQGSELWADWRYLGLGGSDAPVVAGHSPFKTAYVLWLERTGRRPPPPLNPAMRRGHQLEPKGRAMYERMSGVLFMPVCVEHDYFPYLRASLDGLSFAQDLILEVKCPGAKNHAMAKGGEIPYYYWIQMQYQMLVTGIQKGIYFSYWEDADGNNAEGIALDVDGDLNFQKLLHADIAAFWSCITDDVEPTKDGFKELASKWFALKCEHEELASAKSVIESDMAAYIKSDGKMKMDGSGISASIVPSSVFVPWNKVSVELFGASMDSQEAMIRAMAKVRGISEDVVNASIAKNSKNKQEFIRITVKEGIEARKQEFVQRTINPAVVAQSQQIFELLDF